jgi:hypothetical protein
MSAAPQLCSGTQLPQADVALSQAWAAMMLTRRVDVCGSILRGAPVRAGNLDAGMLRHALRGSELPPADDYITVTAEMLAAVEEAGPFDLSPRRRERR